MTSNQPWWLTWPVAEVAATILPNFSCWSSRDEDRAIYDILAWCKTGSFGTGFLARIGNCFEDPDTRAITEAIQFLEHAHLLMRKVSGGDMTSCDIGLTRLGAHAIATNTVRQHLGLTDAPPAV